MPATQQRKGVGGGSGEQEDCSEIEGTAECRAQGGGAVFRTNPSTSGRNKSPVHRVGETE